MWSRYDLLDPQIWVFPAVTAGSYAGWLYASPISWQVQEIVAVFLCNLSMLALAFRHSHIRAWASEYRHDPDLRNTRLYPMYAGPPWMLLPLGLASCQVLWLGPGFEEVTDLAIIVVPASLIVLAYLASSRGCIRLVNEMTDRLHLRGIEDADQVHEDIGSEREPIQYTTVQVLDTVRHLAEQIDRLRSAVTEDQRRRGSLELTTKRIGMQLEELHQASRELPVVRVRKELVLPSSVQIYDEEINDQTRTEIIGAIEQLISMEPSTEVSSSKIIVGSAFVKWIRRLSKDRGVRKEIAKRAELYEALLRRKTLEIPNAEKQVALIDQLLGATEKTHDIAIAVETFVFVKVTIGGRSRVIWRSIASSIDQVLEDDPEISPEQFRSEVENIQQAALGRLQSEARLRLTSETEAEESKEAATEEEEEEKEEERTEEIAEAVSQDDQAAGQAEANMQDDNEHAATRAHDEAEALRQDNGDSDPDSQQDRATDGDDQEREAICE